jgi:broad specificity phosphatase PhoE
MPANLAEINNGDCMPKTTSISLVRHGMVHNPDDVFYGRMPRFRLSSEGQQQVRSAGNVLKNKSLAAVFSSHLLRSRQTANEILTHYPHLKIQLSKLLLEIHSPWDGKPSAVVDHRLGDIYTGSGESYEQPDDVASRVRRFFSRVLKSYSGRSVVAVTHGDVVAFAVLWASRAEVSARNKAGLHKFGVSDGYPATGSITTFLYHSDSVDDPPDIIYTRPK